MSGSRSRVAVYLLLAFGVIQTVFGGQFLADFPIADFNVLVRNGLAVVTDTVINEVAMRVSLIEMPNQQELSVPDAHTLHVLSGDPGHFRVGQLVRILGRERQRDMADCVFQAGIQ